LKVYEGLPAHAAKFNDKGLFTCPLKCV